MNHDNRGKAARVTKTASAVLATLKQQGIEVPDAVAEAAISAAVTNSVVATKQTFRLFFEGPTGQLCRGITESIVLKVGNATLRRTKYRCDDESAAKLVVRCNDAGNNTDERTYLFARWDRESFFEYLQETLGDMDYEFVTDVLSRFETMSRVDFYEPNLRDFNAAIAEARASACEGNVE